MPATSSIAPLGNPDIDGVVSGRKWLSGALTFSFPMSGAYYGTSYSPSNEPATFAVLNATQQNAIRVILGTYAAVANLTFTEVIESASVHGTLRYALSSAPSTAWAYYPSDDPAGAGGDTWIGRSGPYGNPIPGTYAWATLVHETGHALGLKHGHEAAGAFPALPTSHDGLDYSVMTYRSYVGDDLSAGGYTPQSGSYPQTLMMSDIAGLQYIYGADFSSRSGNTVYTWSPTTGQAFIDGAPQSLPSANRILATVWDGGGTDTYDFSNYATNLVVNLNPGAWTTVSPGQLADLGYWSADGPGAHMAHGNIANALLYQGDLRSLIENANGGSGNDLIVGNAGANKLSGGLGHDTLIGGGGQDALYGGDGNDVLYGDGDPNQLGVDTMAGGAGDDFYDVANAGDLVVELAGGGTNDRVWAAVTYQLPAEVENLILWGAARTGIGNSGDNVIRGNDLDNFLFGAGGHDVMFGGKGDDLFELDSNDDEAVELPGEGTNDRVWASADFVLGANVENLILQGTAISGTGNDGDNVIRGNGLNNRITGLGGNDALFGDTGNDTFMFGQNFGNDVLADFQGGAGPSDKLEFSLNLFPDEAAFRAASHQIGPDVVVVFNAANHIIIANTTIAQIHTDDLVFV